MQAQQAIAPRRQSLSTMVAVVATLIAAALALTLVVTVYRPATPATPATPLVVPLHGVGADQIAHNRSEEGLGGSGAAEQRPVVVEQAPYSSPAKPDRCGWAGTPPQMAC